MKFVVILKEWVEKSLTWLSIYIKETQLSCICMNLVSIGLSLAIVAYTETTERIENEQESELKKQTTSVFHSRFRSGIEILSVLFCMKHIFQQSFELPEDIVDPPSTSIDAVPSLKPSLSIFTEDNGISTT